MTALDEKLREQAKLLREYLGPCGADFLVLVEAMRTAAALGAADAEARVMGLEATVFQLKRDFLRAWGDELTANAYRQGAADRQARIVAWLRENVRAYTTAQAMLDAIESGSCAAEEGEGE
jgi:hypothetical protein